MPDSCRRRSAHHLTLLAGALFAASLAPPAAARTVTAILESANNKLRAQDYEGAIVEYEAAIDRGKRGIFPMAKLMSGYGGRAIARIYLGDYVGAEEDATMMIDNATNVVTPDYGHVIRARARFMQGDRQGALEDADAAVAAASRGLATNVRKATALVERGLIRILAGDVDTGATDVRSGADHRIGMLLAGSYGPIRRAWRELASGTDALRVGDRQRALASIDSATVMARNFELGFGHEQTMWMVGQSLRGAFASGPSTVRGRAPEFGGLYRLQGLLRFDRLDGCVVDPDNGTFTLFGHRSSDSVFEPIPYLDHLATALDHPAGDLSLEWTPEANRAVDEVMALSADQLAGKLSSVYDGDGTLTAAGEWFLRACGVQLPADPRSLSREDAVALLYEALDDPKAARIFRSVKDIRRAQETGGDSSTAVMDLIQGLGLQAKWEEMGQRGRAGGWDVTQGMDFLARPLLTALGNTLHLRGPKYADRYEWAREQGRGWEPSLNDAFGVLEKDLSAELGEVVFRDLIGRGKAIDVPPSALEEILGVRFHVQPVVNGVPANSLLARVAMEADIAMKGLLAADHALKARVPGLRSVFDWEREVEVLPGEEGRLWLSPGAFELVESADGRRIEFKSTPVHFNMQRRPSPGAPSVRDPAYDRYAAHLIERYDTIAAALPPLAEMRECYKVQALAHWLRRNGHLESLPVEGRYADPLPRHVPGILSLTLASSSGGPGPAAVMQALGGVDLEFPSPPRWGSGTVRLERDDIVVSPITRTNEQLQRLSSRRVNVPLPPIPGWTAKAKTGERFRQQVTLLVEQVGAGPDAAAALALAKRADAKARLIEHSDGLINAMTERRIESQRRLDQVRSDAQANARALAKEALETVTAGLVDLGDAEKALLDERLFGGFTPAIELASTYRDARGKAQELSDALEKWQKGQVREELVKRLAGELEDIGKKLIEQTDIVRELSDHSAVRQLRKSKLLAIGTVSSLVSMTNGTLAVLDHHRIITEINDNAGNDARLSRQLQSQQRDQINEFLEIRGELEDLVGRAPRR